MLEAVRWGSMRVLLVLVFGVMAAVVLSRWLQRVPAAGRPAGPVRVVGPMTQLADPPGRVDVGGSGAPVDFAVPDPDPAPAAAPVSGVAGEAAPEPGIADVPVPVPVELPVQAGPQVSVQSGPMLPTEAVSAVTVLPGLPGPVAVGPGAGRRADLTLIRVWARGHGYTVADRGRIAAAVVAAYDQAHTEPVAGAGPGVKAGLLPESSGVDRDAIGPGGVSDDGQNPPDGADLGLPGGAAEADADHGAEAGPG